MSLLRNAIAVPGRWRRSPGRPLAWPVRGPREPLTDAGTERQLEVQPRRDGRCRAVRAGGDVGVGRLDHLHHQAGVERMAWRRCPRRTRRRRRTSSSTRCRTSRRWPRRSPRRAARRCAAPACPRSPMVMVRCVGVCALLRVAACARATARSMDVVVASRCAAAMKASASWVLSVFSAWRSSAAMRASILSSGHVQRR